MSDAILGPASIPKPLLRPGDPLRLTINPRFLSGYKPYFSPSQEWQQALPEEESHGTEEALATWRRQAEANLPWLRRAATLDTMAAQRNLVPSRELTMKILEITPYDLAYPNASRHATYRQRQDSEEIDKSRLIDELQEEFATELLTSIANFSFKANITGRGNTYLWLNGEIDDDFGLDLLRVLPIRVGKSERLFAEIHIELLAALRRSQIAGDWGRLQAHGQDIFAEQAPRIFPVT